VTHLTGVCRKHTIRHVFGRIVLTRALGHAGPVDMLQSVSAEMIYCRERARQAREKADAATVAEAKTDYLAAEGRWLALAHSYELQQRLSTMLHEHEPSNGTGSIARMAREGGRAFDPEVVAIMGSAFSAVFADLRLSDRDDAVALRAARRIIELAAAGERDPERLRAATIRWVTEWVRETPAVSSK
jgi:hypothetical protein